MKTFQGGFKNKGLRPAPKISRFSAYQAAKEKRQEMEVKVFDDRTVNVGDKVAYPSRHKGRRVMRRAVVNEIRETLSWDGSSSSVAVKVRAQRLPGEHGYSNAVRIHNLNTLVRL